MEKNIFYDSVPCMDKKTVVALGVFDGVHSGHRTVINEAVSFKEKGFLPVAFTFKTPSVFKKGEKLQAILSDSIKAERLLRLGCEAVISPDFNELKNLSPEDFVKEILVEKLKAGVVVCGDDFRFGKNAQGNCETLKELGKKLDFEVKVVEPFMVSGEVVLDDAEGAY